MYYPMAFYTGRGPFKKPVILERFKSIILKRDNLQLFAKKDASHERRKSQTRNKQDSGWIHNVRFLRELFPDGRAFGLYILCTFLVSKCGLHCCLDIFLFLILCSEVVLTFLNICCPFIPPQRQVAYFCEPLQPMGCERTWCVSLTQYTHYQDTQYPSLCFLFQIMWHFLPGWRWHGQPTRDRQTTQPPWGAGV